MYILFTSTSTLCSGSATNHWIKHHNPKILFKEHDYFSRIILEAVKHRNFNRDDDFKLSSSWNFFQFQLLANVSIIKYRPTVYCRYSDNPSDNIHK